METKQDCFVYAIPAFEPAYVEGLRGDPKWAMMKRDDFLKQWRPPVFQERS